MSALNLKGRCFNRDGLLYFSVFCGANPSAGTPPMTVATNFHMHRLTQRQIAAIPALNCLYRRDRIFYPSAGPTCAKYRGRRGLINY